MFPLKPELHTRLAASHTDRSWTRGLQSPSNSGYLQINEAVMPFAKPTHLALFFPSLLFSCSRSGRGLLSALLIVAKYKARTLFSCTCGCFENGLVSTSASMEMGLISAVRWRRRLSAGKRTIHVRVVRVRERMHTATAMPSLIVPAYRDSRGFVSS